jgi:hypothetical protein
VRVIPAAAGGPKGLVLNPLDRFLFGHWLVGSTHEVHLLGASIGAWRMACATLPDADEALAQLAEDYITQRYGQAPGRAPTPTAVSRAFGRKLDERLGARAGEILSSPRYRLHVFTSRGRHLLRREGRLRTPLGYLGAFVSNAASRRALGCGWNGWCFPIRARRCLSGWRLSQSAGAAGRRPTWPRRSWPAARSRSGWTPCTTCRAHPAAPTGTAASPTTTCTCPTPACRGPGAVPAFPAAGGARLAGQALQASPRRHAALDNVVVLSPSPEWVATLPGPSCPTATTSSAGGDDEAAASRPGGAPLAGSERLADDFAERHHGYDTADYDALLHRGLPRPRRHAFPLTKRGSPPRFLLLEFPCP